MSYDEDELTEDHGFKLNDDTDDENFADLDEPLDPIEEADLGLEDEEENF